MAPSLGVRSWRTLSDETDNRVRNVGLLQRDNLLGCQLHGNRCDRIIEVVELGSADDWCGNTGFDSSQASATWVRGMPRAFATSATRSATFLSASSVLANSRPKASSVSVRMLV